MTPLQKFRRFLTLTIPILLVTLGYELKSYFNATDNFLYAIIVIIASFILSRLLLDVVISIIINSYSLRKLINWNKNIEGLWLIETRSQVNDEFILFNPSILSIRYNSDDDSYNMSACRLGKDGVEKYTFSETINFNINSGNYLNDYQIESKAEAINAIAKGKYFCSPNSRKIDRYNGFVMTYEPQPKLLIQNGKKLSDTFKNFDITSELKKISSSSNESIQSIENQIFKKE
jgi:hypothetical protein